MKLDARGFTLIEMIASLVLVGIIAAMAGLGIVEITRQYVFAQKAGETAQVAQVAMARMVKELTLIRSATASGPTSITFNTPTAAGRTIGWTGSNFPILMNNNTLIENIQNLTLRYYNRYDGTVANGGETTSYIQTSTVMIGISFTVIGAEGIQSTFSGRAFVRN
jgi:prepilin-type N-terminal cleavage/methylation domain-containing protein